jgi:hypothetical protein
MHDASEMLYSDANSLFQTVMFSVSGLMLMAIGGFPAVYPWF